MTAYDPTEVFESLVRCQIELWNLVDAHLRAEHSLGAAAFSLLRVLEARSGCRVNDVASELVITVGGASKLVDRVQEAGLCVRTPDPADGRSPMIGLTRQGRQVLAAATDTVDQELRRRFVPVPVPDVARLATTLTALRSSFAPEGVSR